MHQVIENTIPTISTVEVNSKPTSPTSIIRYKSVEHLNVSFGLVRVLEVRKHHKNLGEYSISRKLMKVS